MLSPDTKGLFQNIPEADDTEQESQPRASSPDRDAVSEYDQEVSRWIDDGNPNCDGY